MKKIVILLNGLVFLLLLFTALKGIPSALFLMPVYGLAVGSFTGVQKKAFHMATFVLNTLALLIGFYMLVGFFLGRVNFISDAVVITFGLFIVLVLIPFLNLLFTSTYLIYSPKKK